MQATNEYLKKGLDQYLQSSNPTYAFLIEGAWGSGKTHFIKKHLFNKNSYSCSRSSKADPLSFPYYLSLNGCADLGDFKGRLFKGRFPVLGSKKLKAFLRSAFGMFRFREFDASAFSIEKGACYIIDDVERCQMPIEVTLGAINELVEHNGCRVVILSNSQEIKDPDKKIWDDQNEKLIGVRFDFNADIDSAFDAFARDIEDGWARSILAEPKLLATLKDVFSLVGRDNLRAARRSIDLTRRVLAVLEEPLRDMSEGVHSLAIYTFANAVSIRSKFIPDTALDELKASGFGRLYSHDKESEVANFYRQLEGFKLKTKQFFAPEDLHRLLRHDTVNAAGINDFLSRHADFREPDEKPAWQTVWRWTRNTDDDFALAWRAMIEEWDKRTYKTPGEILHVAMLLYKAAHSGLTDLEKDEIDAKIDEYLSDIARSGAFTPDAPLDTVSSRRLFETYGLGFSGQHKGLWFGNPATDLLNATRKKIYGAVSNAESQARSEWGRKAIEKLIESEEKFDKIAAWHGGNGGIYLYTPIFNVELAKPLLEGLDKIKDGAGVLDRLYSLSSRYDFNDKLSEQEWKEEVSFLTMLETGLRVQEANSKGIVSLRWRQAADIMSSVLKKAEALRQD